MYTPQRPCSIHAYRTVELQVQGNTSDDQPRLRSVPLPHLVAKTITVPRTDQYKIKRLPNAKCVEPKEMACRRYDLGLANAVVFHFHELALIHAPKNPLPDFIAAYHDRASRGNLEGSRDPAFPKSGDAFSLIDMPEESNHRLLLWTECLARGTSHGTCRISERLRTSLANIKWHGDD